MLVAGIQRLKSLDSHQRHAGMTFTQKIWSQEYTFSRKAAKFAKEDEYIMTLIKDKQNHDNFTPLRGKLK
jgi:hypothetical protein